METNESQYLCLYCGKVFLSLLAVQDHETACDEVRIEPSVRNLAEKSPILFTFPCSTCHRKFARHSDLQIHQKVHTENSFICSYCGGDYGSLAKLRKHESMQHTGMRPFVCDICQKGFNTSRLMDLHKTVHTGEKPHECPICSKTFSRPENFYVHRKLHESGRRFFCSECGRWFASQDEQLKHENQCGSMEASDPTLRYNCDFCDKKFRYIRDKTVHERVHTGDKPYSCGYCFKQFTQSQALTRHIRTHTKEKPYGCGLCGQKFGCSSVLRKHEYLRHPGLAQSDKDESILEKLG